jgi:ankyrin repeat protein
MALRKIGRFFLETFIWNDQDHLLQAVTDGNAHQVQRLLNTGKNLDLGARYSDGFTPLMAIEHGHLGVAEFLPDSGANVDARNSEGETALHCAVRIGSDTGAVTGFTALLAASYNNQEELALGLREEQLYP